MALKLQLQEFIYFFFTLFPKFVVIYFTADVRKPENRKFLWNYFPPSKQCDRSREFSTTPAVSGNHSCFSRRCIRSWNLDLVRFFLVFIFYRDSLLNDNKLYLNQMNDPKADKAETKPLVKISNKVIEIEEYESVMRQSRKVLTRMD